MKFKFSDLSTLANPVNTLKYAGDTELANAVKNVQGAMKAFPRSTTIADGYNATLKALTKARWNFGINATLGVGNTVSSEVSPAKAGASTSAQTIPNRKRKLMPGTMRRAPFRSSASSAGGFQACSRSGGCSGTSAGAGS